MKNKKYTKKARILTGLLGLISQIYRITATTGDRRITAAGDPRITAESE